jgi:hypothetical protein
MVQTVTQSERTIKRVGLNFEVRLSHLKLPEEQGILTHSSFGVRSQI